jgi:excisionase family DNA binding protein
MLKNFEASTTNGRGFFFTKKGTNMNNEKIMTVKEVAEYARLKPITIYRELKFKRLIPLARSGKFLIKESEVKKWLNKR